MSAQLTAFTVVTLRVQLTARFSRLHFKFTQPSQTALARAAQLKQLLPKLRRLMNKERIKHIQRNLLVAASDKGNAESAPPTLYLGRLCACISSSGAFCPPAASASYRKPCPCAHAAP